MNGPASGVNRRRRRHGGTHGSTRAPTIAGPVGLENRIRQVTDLEPRRQLHNKQNRMRRRGCGADLAPGGGAGLRDVNARRIGGTSQVDGGRGVAGLAWQVPRRACRLWSVPVAGRAPGRRRSGPGPRLWQAGASVTCPAGARDGRVTMGALDVAGLSWTSWDMIQNVRRADQAHSEATDATRTERGFHAARNGESAGQRAFRWAGMGSL